MSDTRSEALFDEYLDALLRGECPPPDQFLKERGIDNPALLLSLATLYEHRRPTRAEPPADDPDLDPGAPDPSEPPEGRRLGDFVLRRKLGEGGMGVVWLAEQTSLGRPVALKLLRGESAGSAALLSRFDREARALARLHHPNIVTVYAVGEARGCRFIAMELIEGRGLEEIMDQARERGVPIAPARAVAWCAAIADALHAAHQEGVVHRDVKPSNIRIAPDDRPVLLDFGLAREVGSRAMTMTEGFVGSPAYAAPEQVARRGGEVDARTDVYGLGMVLYELLTGSVPFAGGSLEQVLHAILTEDPPPPRRTRPDVGRDLSVAVMTAIEKNPARRYPSAKALAEDLRAILELRPISARPPGALERAARWARRRRALAGAIAAGLVVAAAAGGVLAWNFVEQSARRHAEIEEAIGQARRLIAGYGDLRARTRDLQEQYERQAGNAVSGYFTLEQDREFADLGEQVRSVRREHDRSLYSTLELVSRAERLGADPARVRRLRAEAYLQRYLQLENAGAIAERDMYREMVVANDPGGELTPVLLGATTWTLNTDPPGAEVFLFRRRLASEVAEQADPRTVLVPHAGPAPAVRCDQWALVVQRDLGTLHEGDLILEVAGRPVQGTALVRSGSGQVRALDRLVSIDGDAVIDTRMAGLLGSPRADGGPRSFAFERDGAAFVLQAPSLDSLGVALASPIEVARAGGVEALVWSDGSTRREAIPPGAELLPTAAPAPLSAASRLGLTPIRSHPIEAGDYLAIVRAPGHETQRVAIRIARDHPNQSHLPLSPAGTTPPGFVRVVQQDAHLPGGWHICWIKRTEVTVREYFEFLNDPATRRRVDESPTPILYPRNGEEARGQRDAEGLFTLPEGWQWDWPVLCVSWHDARAYAQWLTERARARGERRRFDLPDLHEWVGASAPVAGSPYTFGPEFRPKWVSSCFARPRPDPEPVMSFPIDQSVLGVFDLSGSMSEWTRTLWRAGYTYYRHTGGSWGTGHPGDFTVYGGNGLLPDRAVGIVGFRVVMHELPHDGTPADQPDAPQP